METGPGGRQIQVEDPDGNSIELADCLVSVTESGIAHRREDIGERIERRPHDSACKQQSFRTVSDSSARATG